MHNEKETIIPEGSRQATVLWLRAACSALTSGRVKVGTGSGRILRTIGRQVAR